MTDSDLPTGPITDDEVLWLRREMLADARAKWAWKVARRWGAYLATFLTGAYAVYEVVVRHVRLVP